MSKILRRLILYSVAPLAVFAFIIGSIFATLFYRHNYDIHQAELKRQAITIASSLASVYEDLCCKTCGGVSPMRSMHGAIEYLRFIEDLAMSDVWIIDYDLRQITAGKRYVVVTYSDLPQGAEYLIALAFKGETVLCEDSFNIFFDNSSITVATPITFSDGHIIGAVLLHTQMPNLQETTGRGLALLLHSMIAAILVSVLVIILLSSRFTMPLRKMKTAAMRISGGNFNVRTGVTQSDEIGELAAVLDAMAEKFAIADIEHEKLEKLRRDFVAAISHELRTPVTIIRGSLEVICDGLVADLNEAVEFSRHMLGECKYLERLVSDLLDLSLLQNTEFSIELGSVNLREVTMDAIMSMKEIARQKNVRIFFSCGKKNIEIMADYGRLRQMLVILLDNAVKFSPENGIINVKVSAVTKIEASISIRDQGPGISADAIGHVFERFYKERSDKNKHGTGLGLALAKEIASRHSATLSVVSSPNAGTEFIFTTSLKKTQF